jgi:hypothetical protein
MKAMPQQHVNGLVSGHALSSTLGLTIGECTHIHGVEVFAVERGIVANFALLRQQSVGEVQVDDTPLCVLSAVVVEPRGTGSWCTPLGAAGRSGCATTWCRYLGTPPGAATNPPVRAAMRMAVRFMTIFLIVNSHIMMA